MVQIIEFDKAKQNSDLVKLLNGNNLLLREEMTIVSQMIKDIIQDGDKALFSYTNKFDNIKIDEGNCFFSEDEINEALNIVDKKLISALEQAKERIIKYHENILPAEIIYPDQTTTTLGNLWRPMSSVGIYVPGGLASYPSSVLMNALPAKVAGVENIIMCVPTPNGNINPLVLAAAKICEIDKIYKIGGAQAIAAMAYGTDSVSKVDFIAGPGNIYVTLAKKLVFGQVGIDMIAGPSEILIIADKDNDPDWIATDLLSQAEHDVMARSLLICNDKEFAHEVASKVEEILLTLPRRDIARKSWQDNGLIITVKSFADAIYLTNMIAPEHLELMFKDAANYIKDIKNAGAIFVGKYTPESIGDYIAGPSHVLPTSGTAKFSSGLSVYSFLKRISYIECSQNAFQNHLAKNCAILAKEEGLDAHAMAITKRLSK